MSGSTSSKNKPKTTHTAMTNPTGGGGGGGSFTVNPSALGDLERFDCAEAAEDDDDGTSFSSLNDEDVDEREREETVPSSCFDGLMADGFGSETEGLSRLKARIESIKLTESSTGWNYDPRYLAVIRDDSEAVNALLESYSKDNRMPPYLLHVAILAGALNSVSAIIEKKDVCTPQYYLKLFGRVPIQLVSQALKEKPTRSSLMILKVFHEQKMVQNGWINTLSGENECLLSILGAYDLKSIVEIGESYFNTIWETVIPDYTQLTNDEWPDPDLSRDPPDESSTLREIARKSNNPWLIRYLNDYAQMQNTADKNGREYAMFRLTAIIKTEKSKLAEVEAQLEASRDEVSRITEEITASRAESLVATEESKKLRSNQKDKDRELKNLRNQIKALKAAQSKADRHKTAREGKEREVLTSRITELETQLSTIRADKERTAETLELKQSTLAALGEELKKAKGSEAKTRLEFTDMKRQILSLRKEVSELKENLDTAHAQLDENKDRETLLQEQITSLNAAKAELESRASAQNAEHEALHQEIDRLNAELTESKTRFFESLMTKKTQEDKPSREIETLKEKNEKLSAALVLLHEQKEKLDERIKSLLAERAEMLKTHKKQLASMRRGIKGSNGKTEGILSNVKKELANLQEAFSAVSLERITLASQLAEAQSVRGENEEILNARAREITQLHSQLAEARSIRGKNEELLHTRAREITQLQSQIDELNGLAWGWAHKCKHAEANLMALREINSDLNSKMSLISSPAAETSATVVGVGAAAGGSATAFAPTASAPTTVEAASGEATAAK